MRAGQLNRRVEIRRRGEPDALGQPADVWESVGTVWASIKHTSGMKAVLAGADTTVVRASIRLRYRRDITIDMRLVHGEDHYTVEAALPDEVRREYVDLVCRLLSTREVGDEAGA